MTKLTLLTFVVCTVAVVFFNIAESIDETKQHEENEGGPYDVLEDDVGESDRSGASAYASASLRPRVAQGNRPLTTGPGAKSGIGVECYVCTDCQKVQDNTTSKICPYTLDRSKQKTCVVYAEQYRHMKRPWYIRGCASERGSCLDIKQAHSAHSDIVKLNFCYECEGDKCNTSGATRSISDFTMAFFALIVTPIVAKYTLS